MFSNLFNFGYQRSGSQALGFYVAYFIILTFMNVLLSNVYAVITGQTASKIGEVAAFETGFRLGATMVIVYCFILSSVIVAKKKQLSAKAALLVLASVAMAVLLGVPGGLVITSYLTTISKNP